MNHDHDHHCHNHDHHDHHRQGLLLVRSSGSEAVVEVYSGETTLPLLAKLSSIVFVAVVVDIVVVVVAD